jgi:prefoldin subunit 5
MYPATMSEIAQADSVALGITVDSENQVVILVTVTKDDVIYGVGLSPEVARHVGRSIRGLSREADMLQDELDDLDPEEIVDRLEAIHRRYLNGQPPPSETP